MPDTTHIAARLAPPVPGGLAHMPITVVGVGASAGGLEACTRLIRGLPDGNGMAFILVQHLDPTHDSMLVELLSNQTAMPVLQAAEGKLLERDHVYIIPPGFYLSVVNGLLHLSTPTAPRGKRLPFDFLLGSLAAEYGNRAVCVVLSGTGEDGTLGLTAIKAAGGLVIAQDPEEAEYDGMPRSAIATGAVDLVLAIDDIPDALATHPFPLAAGPSAKTETGDAHQQAFTGIIELLRVTTPHDFTLYKPGTLQRRVERRMALAGAADLDRYLVLLRSDKAELGRLASDLLINVTSFFRDAKVFDRLAADIIPDMIRGQDPEQPLRVWVAGCSTGEETWSLAMVFREQLAALKSGIKLQIFASDVDADAVATARAGNYAEATIADVSADRLARFFIHDEHEYRILPELRSLVVFTVQDVLADPPFSRLDFISCRNLLIYLRPEAQTRVLSLFDFALNEGGILLLGAAETPGRSDGRFETIGKAERLYRRVGQGRPAGVHFPVGAGGRAQPGPMPVRAPTTQATLAALGQRLLLDAYGPAAVLVNSKQECLYSMGPINRYLQVASGSATQDLLSLARESVRPKLRAALREAGQGGGAKAPSMRAGAVPFCIEVRQLDGLGEATQLISFVERPELERYADPARPGAEPQVALLEQELAAMRVELAEAIRSSEAANEEQKAQSEEALSVNEEYQSTNEELLTSKEELQSLNEELTALNSQLQETLERQRTTANDMQNVLYSTDVATLFLDRQFNIRFFTPATRLLFSVIPSDVGRPLTDLVSLAADAALPHDVRAVLEVLTPIEREIEANGVWFMRRVLPYRTEDKGVEGVVITFTDITERKNTARALEAAKQEAERANAAKSRFLSAASHDLRQPLQTLALLQGLLAKAVAGLGPQAKGAEKLVARLDDTLSAMSGMLNTVLDINQIEAGVVAADMSDVPIGAMLARLEEEYGYLAQAQGLRWRVVPCSLSVRSDPRLLEQMVRNLVSNALKYTKRGRVLLGCRRHGAALRIEVWDTGVGISADKLDAIFEEYNQLDNAARDRGKGLGLGLSIVQRLSFLLGHKVSVRSTRGRGSVFTIEVALAQGGQPPRASALAVAAAPKPSRTGAILVVEDDPAVRDLLQIFLAGEGHHVAAAADGDAALKLVATATANPDLLLTDYNLPGDMTGLQLAARLREKREPPLPVIVLTGDISAAAMLDIAQHECVPLSKPVKLDVLTEVLQRLLPEEAVPSGAPPPADAEPGRPVIFIIDDDDSIRTGLRELLEGEGRVVECHPSAESFLRGYKPDHDACLLVDATLPGLSGLDLLRRLRGLDDRVPAIMITGHGDVHMAVEAMKAGASDFIEKPVSRAELLASLERAFEQSSDSGKLSSWRATASHAVHGLTERQRHVMALVIAGHPSKNIATDLGISQRTVENHRAAIMERTGCKSLPALARLALAAAWTGSDESLVAAGQTAKVARD